jgi:hypothetical protein
MSHAAGSAVVSRAPVGAYAPVQYLTVRDGASDWTADLAAATTFASMREATRAALRLPSATRAFGLPLQSEIILQPH